MKEVIIRSNYGKNIGLGHLYRSLKLANQLKKYYKVTFAIDKKSKITNKILTYNVIELYKNSSFRNQIKDANLLKKKLTKKISNLLLLMIIGLVLIGKKFFLTILKLLLLMI